MLSRITLQLARNPGIPAGDAERGYFIVAPIGAEERIDLEAWRKQRDACHVRRFHPDEDEVATGHLTHLGHRWFIKYEDEDQEEETIFRFEDQHLKEGEYVSIAFHGETALTYKITDISPV
jgi:hypothetical protein